MTSNVVPITQFAAIEPLSNVEIEYVDGGARASNAAVGVAAAVWGVWVGAFTVGVAIGTEIGHAIFGKDTD